MPVTAGLKEMPVWYGFRYADNRDHAPARAGGKDSRTRRCRTGVSVSAFVKHAVGVALFNAAGWKVLLGDALQQTGGHLLGRSERTLGISHPLEFWQLRAQAIKSGRNAPDTPDAHSAAVCGAPVRRGGISQDLPRNVLLETFRQEEALAAAAPETLADIRHVQAFGAHYRSSRRKFCNGFNESASSRLRAAWMRTFDTPR